MTGKRVGFCGAQVATEQSDIILDSGSTISLFRDEAYLTSVENSKQHLVMETNAGSKMTTKIGEVPGYWDIWYDKQAISNLFSVSDMVTKGHRVQLHTDLDNAFLVTSRTGKSVRFTVDERGLYVKETIYADGYISKDSDDEEVPALVPTTHHADESDDESEDEAEHGEVHTTEVEGFTQREVDRAKKCRKLLHDLSAPSYADLRKLLRMNLLKNCPVSHENVVLAQRIFGKDVAVLKGNEVKPKPPVVNKADVVDLPPELMIVAAELAIDVIFVENEAFLHCVDQTLKGKSVVPLGTTKKAKGADLLDVLKKVVRYYNKADISITRIHAGNEF